MWTKERNTETTTYQDKFLECPDCGDHFILEAGEQYFMARKGLAQIKRCPACRQRRRQAIQGDSGAVPRW